MKMFLHIAKIIIESQFCIRATVLLSIYLALPKPRSRKIHNHSFLHDILLPEKRLSPFREELWHFDAMQLGNQSYTQSQTILIEYNIRDLKFIKRVYATLKTAKWIKRRFVFVARGYEDFTHFNKICRNFTPSKYFISLYLHLSNESRTVVNIFSNLQPNSDLVFLAARVFPETYRFDVSSLFTTISNHNNLDISFNFSIDDFYKLIWLLRCFNSVPSLTNGTYFYQLTPCGGYVNFEDYFPFIVTIVALIIVGGINTNFICRIQPIEIVHILICMLTPSVASIFILFRRRNAFRDAFYLSLFAVFNMRVGLFMTLLAWLRLLFYKRWLTTIINK